MLSLQQLGQTMNTVMTQKTEQGKALTSQLSPKTKNAESFGLQRHNQIKTPRGNSQNLQALGDIASVMQGPQGNPEHPDHGFVLNTYSRFGTVVNEVSDQLNANPASEKNMKKMLKKDLGVKKLDMNVFKDGFDIKPGAGDILRENPEYLTEFLVNEQLTLDDNLQHNFPLREGHNSGTMDFTYGDIFPNQAAADFFRETWMPKAAVGAQSELGNDLQAALELRREQPQNYAPRGRDVEVFPHNRFEPKRH